MQSRGHQAGEVRHVDHEIGPDLVGDPAELREVELSRVGRPAGEDQLGTPLVGHPLDLGHVDEVVVLGHVVGRDVVQLAGEVQLHPMGEVTAVRQCEAEDGVAGGQQRGHRRGVGLGARMRLHVGVFRAEQCGHAVDGELLDHVDVLAAAVVAPARIALGVLVGQHRPLGLHHRQRSEVLTRDHLQRGLLAGQLGGDRVVHRGIELGQGRAKEWVRGPYRRRHCGIEGHGRLPGISLRE